MDIWIISRFWLLLIELYERSYKNNFCGHRFSFLLDPRSEIIGSFQVSV